MLEADMAEFWRGWAWSSCRHSTPPGGLSTKAILQSLKKCIQAVEAWSFRQLFLTIKEVCSIGYLDLFILFLFCDILKEEKKQFYHKIIIKRQ